MKQLALVLLGTLFSLTATAEMNLKGRCDFNDTLPDLITNDCFLPHGAISYSPRYPLWTDGAEKKRWIFIPRGQKVDNYASDYWKFPIGTIAVKEFSLDGIKLETRYLLKISDEKWKAQAYAWNMEQTEAFPSQGAQNVLGTNHDIPGPSLCKSCHHGGRDHVLGFSDVQLSSFFKKFLAVMGLLERPLNKSEIQNTKEWEAIGYLHGNCAHCHLNKVDVHPGFMLGMDLRVLVDEVLEDQPAYETAVNVPMLWDRKRVWDMRIKSGSPCESAIYRRMLDTHQDLRMPNEGTEVVDAENSELIKEWIQSLPEGSTRKPLGWRLRNLYEILFYTAENELPLPEECQD